MQLCVKYVQDTVRNGTRCCKIRCTQIGDGVYFTVAVYTVQIMFPDIWEYRVGLRTNPVLGSFTHPLWTWERQIAATHRRVPKDLTKWTQIVHTLHNIRHDTFTNFSCFFKKQEQKKTKSLLTRDTLGLCAWSEWVTPACQTKSSHRSMTTHHHSGFVLCCSQTHCSLNVYHCR